MKVWECIQVNHHKDIGKTIETWQSNGWRLHSYACAQRAVHEINHYLLFEKGNDE